MRFKSFPILEVLGKVFVGRPGTVLVGGAMVGYCCWYCWRLATGADINNYLRDLNINDTYYYYTLARNQAAGLFSTADGINQTNGFHPLWSWLITPLFWFWTDPEQALPALKVFELALLGLSGIAMVATSRESGMTPWLMLPIPIILLSNQGITAGMEAAPLVLALSVTMWLLVRMANRPSSRASCLGLAVVLGLLPWIRLEALAITFTITVAWVLYSRLMRLDRQWPLWSLPAIAGALVAAYFLFNQLAFGTPVPVSGQLKAFWSQFRWKDSGGYDFFVNLKQHIDNKLYWQTISSAIPVAVVLVVSWATKHYRTAAYRVNHAIDFFMLGLAVFGLARFGFSVLRMYVMWSAYSWYFAPTVLLNAVIWPWAIFRVWSLIPEERRSLAPLLLGTALWLTQVNWLAAETRLEKTTTRKGGKDWEMADYEAVQWMKRNLPKNAVVGSTDSGVLSYFAPFRVINLDGLVNSNEFRKRQEAGTLGEWITESGITHFSNVVYDNQRDGCRVMARRMRQNQPLPGKCELVWQGPRVMKRQRSRVWSFAPKVRRGQGTTTKDWQRHFEEE